MMPRTGRGVFTWMSRMYRFVGPGLVDMQDRLVLGSALSERNALFGHQKFLVPTPLRLYLFN